jgi:hypothetical protein
MSITFVNHVIHYTVMNVKMDQQNVLFVRLTQTDITHQNVLASKDGLKMTLLFAKNVKFLVKHVLLKEYVIHAMMIDHQHQNVHA